MAFELKFRSLDDGDGTLDDHKGKTINLVIGLSGSGKTSMIQILAGGKQTPVRTKSGTQDPVLCFDRESNKLWLDTAGMCDSSDDDIRKAQMRDAILHAIKKYMLRVGRVFVCVACDQNLNSSFAHEYYEFMDALIGAQELTRVVITKVTDYNVDEIDELFLRNYRDAFNCMYEVLLHGYGRFNHDAKENSIHASSKVGIPCEYVGEVTENIMLINKIQELNTMLKHHKDEQNRGASDSQGAEFKIQELLSFIRMLDENVDDLLSRNVCGMHSEAIRRENEKIVMARAQLEDAHHKLNMGKISQAQASYLYNEAQKEMDGVRARLEERLTKGSKLAEMANSVKAFTDFFATVRDYLSD